MLCEFYKNDIRYFHLGQDFLTGYQINKNVLLYYYTLCSYNKINLQILYLIYLDYV